MSLSGLVSGRSWYDMCYWAYGGTYFYFTNGRTKKKKVLDTFHAQMLDLDGIK